MRINGSCHCGSVSFVADIDPNRVLACHCTDCQTLSGAPFRAVVTVPIEQFSLSGAPKAYIKVADSGNRRAQMFCPNCGTNLYAMAAEDPTWVSIRLGCVEQRSLLKPAAQIWQHSAVPWLAELSAVPGSPEQQAFSPPASLTSSGTNAA
jgi:hypothetical protein